MEEKHFRDDKVHKSLEGLRLEVKENHKLKLLIDRLPTMKDKDSLRADDALSIVYTAEQAAENTDLNEVTIPGIPDNDYLDEFDGWTVKILRAAIKAIAEKEEKTFDDMLSATKFKITLDEAKAKLQLEQATKEIGRKRRTRLLPEPHVITNISRYEAHLERSLYKTMHELERLQATRAGQPVPPPAAVDVTVDVS